MIGQSGRIAPIHRRCPFSLRVRRIALSSPIPSTSQCLKLQASRLGKLPRRAGWQLALPRSLAATSESKIRSGFLTCYPADAVQADYPVPFSNGWMTVVAASDFQSRLAILCGRPSLLVLSNSGSGISPRNLEHRRVNVRSRNQNHFGTAEEPSVES
jgi:hypothetical protein